MLFADGSSPGGLGFLVVVVFVIAAAGIFVAMTRSMRRMRGHVDRGDFGEDESRPSSADQSPPGPSDPPAGI
jgi:hypothetical protein